jgi:prepilin-type N-terminal cleavage/methylation domain-containing protein
MTTSTKRLQKGFTLIELLTVIAIIGILAAIIIPTVGKVRDTAAKSVAASNLRQIGQAALIYASDNKDQLPKWTEDTNAATFGTAATTAKGETVEAFAAALAVGGGLNDATIWVVSNDKVGTTTTGASTVFTPTGTGKAYTSTGTPTFKELSMAFGVVIGLTTSDSSTTPIAFTRGILTPTTAGSWAENTGVYGTDGGHIVFLGGNVQYYRNLGATETAGELIGSNGSKTNDITKTLKTSNIKKFIEETPAGTGVTTATADGG